MTSVTTKNPLWHEFITEWEKMRQTYRGERIVKEAGTRYLPPTSGMVADGMQVAESPGFKAYQSYRARAAFPDSVTAAVDGMLGVMHRKPPIIELPAVMEPMREMATIKHESLEMLLRRINEAQLIFGRCGLLADFPDQQVSADSLPYIALYQAERITNWDEGDRDLNVIDSLNLVVLDESEFERVRGFEWELKQKFRVLILGDQLVNENPGEGAVYSAGVFHEDTTLQWNEADMVTPMVRGQTLDEIPFVFINTRDIVPTPDDPPLLGLANAVLTIYRGEADYRQALFMQGQDTLVITGGDPESSARVGANSQLHVPQGGDAKYIGVDSKGLPEMRMALENDYARAAEQGGQLMDSVSRARESGDALKIRVAARTANLNQLALTGAFGLEQSLRQIAKWIGANPEEVIVIPNLDFVADTMPGKELVDYTAAKNAGAPYSDKSLHKLMQDRGLTEMDYDEEIAELENEQEAQLEAQSTNPEGLMDDAQTTQEIEEEQKEAGEVT